jgi:methionyl-tRNA formyltransferase
MRIVFMGTPEFAAIALERLYLDGHDVSAVFTKPDVPQNRGMKLGVTPVKALAVSHNTPVFQPTSLKTGEVVRQLQELAPELIVVVAYGKLLPQEILSLPPYGCINIHGSILPKYRGSAPIQWAVLRGEKTTGVTSMYLVPEMDAGDIIKIKTLEIGEYETAGELYGRLAVLGAELLSETLSAIISGDAPRIQKNNEEATYAPPLTKEMSAIDWTQSKQKIICQIRGLNPWPVASSVINGIAFKIYSAVMTEHQTSLQPGSIVKADQEGIEICCADGSIIIRELQVSGGRRMSAGDYLRGHPICQ